MQHNFFLFFILLTFYCNLNAKDIILKLKDGSHLLVDAVLRDDNNLKVTFLKQNIVIPTIEIESIQTIDLVAIDILSLPKEEVVIEEAVVVKKPRITGRVDLSLTAWDGNTKSKEGSLASKAEINKSKGLLTIDSLGSYSSLPGAKSENSGFFRSRYDFNHNDNRYNFYLARLGFSEFEGIPNSQLIGYGLGFILKDNGMTTKLSVGLTANRENKITDDSVKLSSVIGLEHKRTLAKSIKFEGDLNLYPSLEDFSNSFKADGTIAFLFPVSSTVDWKLSVFGRYNEAALPTEEKLDTRLMSSISMKF